MTFNDKFKFLMDITNTNNTTLAGAVGIDNSAVSLYRSGKRKCPRNKEILRRMSDYFAASIKLSYQRKALALASDYSRFPMLPVFFISPKEKNRLLSVLSTIFLPLKTMVQYMYGLMMMFTVYLIIRKFLILYRSFCSD